MAASKKCTFPKCDKKDRPNMVASLGARAFYVWVVWFILGKDVSEGHNFFVTLSVFAFPLFMDYVKFTPVYPARKIMKVFGVVFSALWLFVGIVGVFQAISVYKRSSGDLVIGAHTSFVNHSFVMPVETFWIVLAISPIIALIDFGIDYFDPKTKLIVEGGD